MKNFCAYFLVLLTSISCGQTTPANKDENDFYPVTLRMVQEVSSATAKSGQPVGMEVASPLVVDGRTLIATGAHVSAYVVEARHRGHNRREGKVAITVRSVSGADGKELAVRTATFREGSGRGEPIFGPCTFPIPADPAGMFRRGHDVVIPKGYTITVALPKGT